MFISLVVVVVGEASSVNVILYVLALTGSVWNKLSSS